MKFEVQFSDRAIKDLKALPEALQSRILQKLEEATGDPARFFQRLSSARTHRMRVGDHRILADLIAAESLIRVLHIGHRKNVYN